MNIETNESESRSIMPKKAIGASPKEALEVIKHHFKDREFNRSEFKAKCPCSHSSILSYLHSRGLLARSGDSKRWSYRLIDAVDHGNNETVDLPALQKSMPVKEDPMPGDNQLIKDFARLVTEHSQYKRAIEAISTIIKSIS